MDRDLFKKIFQALWYSLASMMKAFNFAPKYQLIELFCFSRDLPN